MWVSCLRCFLLKWFGEAWIYQLWTLVSDSDSHSEAFGQDLEGWWLCVFLHGLFRQTFRQLDGSFSLTDDMPRLLRWVNVNVVALLKNQRAALNQLDLLGTRSVSSVVPTGSHVQNRPHSSALAAEQPISVFVCSVFDVRKMVTSGTAGFIGKRISRWRLEKSQVLKPFIIQRLPSGKLT